MLFFNVRYKYLLDSRLLYASLKNSAESELFNVDITVDGFKFFDLPVGSSLNKKSTLVNSMGEIVAPEHYTKEIESEIKYFEKKAKIPRFKLWKGCLFLLCVAMIGCIFFGIIRQGSTGINSLQKGNPAESLKEMKEEQLFTVVFFADAEGNNISDQPSGWVRLRKIDGDTIFFQRSKKTLKKPLLTFDELASIKPSSETDWSSRLEKIDYPLVKDAAKNDQTRTVNLFYIGKDLEKKFGVIMVLKSADE